MPVRPSERCRYPADWPAISRRIRERAGNRCEWCAAPNGEVITRTGVGDAWERHTHTGTCMGEPCPPGTVRVVLTVAHLDHTPENCDPANLAALCQRCHNRYDAPTRRQGRRERLGVLLLPLEADHADA